MCRSFDLICYKTILKELYGIDDFSAVNVDATKYKNHQSEIFSKSFLDENIKIGYILTALE